MRNKTDKARDSHMKILAMQTDEHIIAYSPLFEHMKSEHGLTLLESELQEIIRLSDEVKRLYNEASERLQNKVPKIKNCYTCRHQALDISELPCWECGSKHEKWEQIS